MEEESPRLLTMNYFSASVSLRQMEGPILRDSALSPVSANPSWHMFPGLLNFLANNIAPVLRALELPRGKNK